MQKALTAQKKPPGTDHSQRLLNNSMYLHCSMCYLRQKKFQQAADQLKNIKTTPRITDYYKAHYVYAQLKAKQNLWEEGFSHLQKIPRTHPIFISFVTRIYDYYRKRARSERMNKSKHNSASTSSQSPASVINDVRRNKKRNNNAEAPTDSNKKQRLLTF